MNSTAPATTLPAMLYLLSIDLDKHKLADRKKTGYILRAAALIELAVRGNLADVDGKVRVRNDMATGDPVLDAVLAEIAATRDRSWKDWTRHHDGEMVDAVEAQLVRAGSIAVHKHALLGDKVEVLDSTAIGPLQRLVVSTLSGQEELDRLDRRDAALTALAAIGELRTAIPDKERKAHQARVRLLTDQIGTSALALQSLVTELRWRRTNTGWINAATAR